MTLQNILNPPLCKPALIGDSPASAAHWSWLLQTLTEAQWTGREMPVTLVDRTKVGLPQSGLSPPLRESLLLSRNLMAQNGQVYIMGVFPGITPSGSFNEMICSPIFIFWGKLRISNDLSPIHPFPAVSEKWSKLRALIPSVIRQSPSKGATHAVAPPPEVNIIDELIIGLWFERDDNGHRWVPVLLHRLRIRISDSLHPLHAHKAVFRIECEYANGAARGSSIGNFETSSRCILITLYRMPSAATKTSFQSFLELVYHT